MYQLQESIEERRQQHYMQECMVEILPSTLVLVPVRVDRREEKNAFTIISQTRKERIFHTIFLKVITPTVLILLRH